MDLKLHANATTTPKTRAYIQRSTASVAELARELGVSETTVRRWRRRETVTDRSHTPKKLSISLTLEEEVLVRELRTEFALSLDDITEVMRRCVNDTLSRSAIHRCLQRHGISRRPKPDKLTSGTFETTGFGFVHVDLKHLTRLEKKPAYVFVAIERTTSFVHVEIVHDRSARTIAACWERFLETFGYPVHTVLTDNGSEFTDRFAVDKKGKPEDKPSGDHPFDLVCAANGITHKLIRPYHPQTNGKVERFNRRLSEVLDSVSPNGRNRGRNRFDDHAQRNAFILQFVDCYNRTRLRSLDYQAPLERLANLPGHNTKAGETAVGALAPLTPKSGSL
jgi:transposase-like protein